MRKGNKGSDKKNQTYISIPLSLTLDQFAFVHALWHQTVGTSAAVPLGQSTVLTKNKFKKTTQLKNYAKINVKTSKRQAEHQ